MRKLQLLWLSLCAPLSLFAQVPLHRIETIPANPRPGTAFQIQVSGTWPNTCAPEVLPVVVDGLNIDVSVRQREQICGDALTPYSVTFDPAAVAGADFPTDAIYRVRFLIKDAATRSRTLAFRAVDVGLADARSVQPEAGFWMPDTSGEFLTSGSGIGFMVERQGATLAVTTNAYTLGGQATWYLSAGTVNGSVFRGELLRSIGGQPLWGTYRGPQSVEPAGIVDIEFASDASAVVWFARPSGEGILDSIDLMPVSVRRMNFALPSDGQGLAGTWAFTATSAATELGSAVMQLSYRADRSSNTQAVLLDAQRGFELRCALDVTRADGPPRSCQLFANGAERARFDNNSISRLSGKSAAQDVVLTRIGN